MDYDSFNQEVRLKAHIAEKEEADKSIKAVLKTLSERLAGNEAEHLKRQLPPEISGYIYPRNEGESFSAEEFFERVADREKDISLDAAIRHSRAVIEVLCEAVSEGDDLKAQLPQDFEILFAAAHK